MLDAAIIEKFELRISFELVQALPTLKANEILRIPARTSDGDGGTCTVMMIHESENGPYTIIIEGKNNLNVNNNEASCDISKVKFTEVKRQSNPNTVAEPTRELQPVENPAQETIGVKKRKVGRPKKLDKTPSAPKSTIPSEETIGDLNRRVLRSKITPTFKVLTNDESDSDSENKDAPSKQNSTSQEEIPKTKCPLCHHDFVKLHRHVTLHHSRHPDCRKVLETVEDPYGKKQKTKCNICGKMVWNLKPHKDLHRKRDRVLCTLCNKEVYCLEKHNMRMHSIEPRQRTKCHICEKDVLNMSVHMYKAHKRPNQFSCDKCMFTTHDKYTLKTHMRNVHENIRNHTCDECGAAFKTSAVLKSHVEVVHQGKRGFQCEVCSKKFTKRYHLQIHSRMHTGEKPFTCRFCGKGFKDKSNLSTHIECVHLQIFRYKCQICDLNFRRRKPLLEHMASFHSDEKISKDGLSSESTVSIPTTSVGSVVNTINLQSLNYAMLSSLTTLPPEVTLVNIPVSRIGSHEGSVVTTSQADLSSQDTIYVSHTDPQASIKLFNEIRVQLETENSQNDGSGVRTICCMLPTSIAQDINLSTSADSTPSQNSVVLPEAVTTHVGASDASLAQHSVMLSTDTVEHVVSHGDGIELHVVDDSGKTANDISYSDMGLTSEADAAAYVLFQSQDETNSEL